ncbi:hypothetical protein RHGRI_031694 [Rhododendron griersonianum]|uniref:Cyclin A1 n=1 Tax=Rhododendron griersonianum TaxID=479676 RepID=A0AAV6ICN2_9ERIC|nr:hypothetical protein RHGRI_031694 [Rhododendron griersonianum]
MSTQNRRSSVTTTSSLAKRQAENLGKAAAGGPPHMAKKRPALANVTNQRQGPQNGPRSLVSGSSNMVPCATKTANAKKISSTCISNAGFPRSTLPAPLNVKPSVAVSSKSSPFINYNDFSRIPSPAAPCSMDISSPHSHESSVSMDESMSTCDSLKSPEFEYVDNIEMTAVDSIERRTSTKLYISEHVEAAETICKRDILAQVGIDDEVVDVDDNFMDPQLCATMACDIYKHLRATEAKKRPSTDFMERVQKDINASMRAILVDWLVEETTCIVTKMIDIARKYEEICAPQVEEFCYITDNTYFKEEVLQMESAVLNYMKFEMTAPTAKCFLRRFVRAAQGVNEAPSMQLECLANYIAELSLLEYNMLCYAPSVIAASAIFLAKYMLIPSKRPWNSTLRHYTLYQPSDLSDCVKALHSLCCNSQSSSLPAIREKYSQHKYKLVAQKYCPPAIPAEYFQNLS